MFRRFAPLLILISLAAAACTSEGVPSSYTDQEGRAETQFVNACESSMDGADNASEHCQCAFYSVASQLSFQQFLDLDKKLQEDPANLSFEEKQLLSDISLPCEYSAADVNTASTNG